MVLRRLVATGVGRPLATALARLNARHPWSHNDHFHGWIMANLPEQRRAALDVGCGHGELVAALSAHFVTVCGNDVDQAMRESAAIRCAGLSNVTIHNSAWSNTPGPFDLVTMIAVLHHLDVAVALRDVGRLLVPGGRFLAVGLAPPRSLRDYMWDAVSAVTNPIIGYVKHPWPSKEEGQRPAFPVRDPTMSFDDLRQVVAEVMPGATMRHRIGFRHTIAWTKPR